MSTNESCSGHKLANRSNLWSILQSKSAYFRTIKVKFNLNSDATSTVVASAVIEWVKRRGEVAAADDDDEGRVVGLEEEDFVGLFTTESLQFLNKLPFLSVLLQESRFQLYFYTIKSLNHDIIGKHKHREPSFLKSGNKQAARRLIEY